MFHVGAVNHVADYLAQVQKKQKTLTPSEKLLVDKKNATVPGVVLTSGLVYSIPNHLAFKFILKDYPIYRIRHFFTAGMFLFGVGNGIKQAGSKFLIEFCSLPDSQAAYEAREIVRKENPQHPFLLAVEHRMSTQEGATLGNTSNSSEAWKPQQEQQGATTTLQRGASIAPYAKQEQQQPVIHAFEESSYFGAPPSAGSKSTTTYNEKTNSQQHHAKKKFVGEDAFNTAATPVVAAEGDSLWDDKPQAAAGAPAPVKKTWEDIQREFDQKRGL